MTPLCCPICHASLGKNEALIIEHDAIGTLIVYHYIPLDVGSRGDSHDSLRTRVANSPTKELHFDASYGTPNARYCCGEAGYKGVHFDQRIAF